MGNKMVETYRSPQKRAMTIKYEPSDIDEIYAMLRIATRYVSA
jgi:hypothetical protein